MQLIFSDPKIMMGKPVITGTRVTVESILEALGAGESIEQIESGHPRRYGIRGEIAPRRCGVSRA